MNPQQRPHEVSRTKSYVTIQELSDLESDSTSNVEEEADGGIEDESEGSETASVGNVQQPDSEPEGNSHFLCIKELDLNLLQLLIQYVNISSVLQKGCKGRN